LDEWILNSKYDFDYDISMRNRKRRRETTATGAAESGRKVQTTLRLPRQLYERAKFFVESGSKGSVNDLIVNALSAYMRALERKAIDEAFLPMAADKRYQREAVRLAEQFSASDAEAIELGERDLTGN
jgi:hypothetical protein